MARVTGEIVINRPRDIVFDVVADQRGEPLYNPALLRAEMITNEPIGVGSRFKAVHASGRGTMQMTVELTEYDRPRRLASVTTASWADIRGAVTFDSVADATRMRWCWDVRPTGLAKWLTPVVGVVGRRQERRCWEGLKSYLEDGERQAAPSRRTRRAWLPPRWFVVMFWHGHRALVRATRGRLGLWRPKPDGWGALWLTTIGRRTGRPRQVLVGYFEDGDNLVTMAMNGWGAAEPAWWVNLQAHPEATAQTRDGTRRVRAYRAHGAERERLWSRWAEIDKNLDEYAARRPTETAVVVLEPWDALP